MKLSIPKELEVMLKLDGYTLDPFPNAELCGQEGFKRDVGGCSPIVVVVVRQDDYKYYSLVCKEHLHFMTDSPLQWEVYKP